MISVLVASGCAARPAARASGPERTGFAEAERQLYPYRVVNTAVGHRQLGQLIKSTRDGELRAAACYHYLRSSLDVAALAFYPIAAADGRPDRLLPIAQMVREMPLDSRAAAICSAVPRALTHASAWGPAWESLAALVDALSAGRRADVQPAKYHAALRRLATAADGVGMRARFHLVGGCLASFFTVYRAESSDDAWARFIKGCGYVQPGAQAMGPAFGPAKEQLAGLFDRMAHDLQRAIGALPEDPFSAFATHQLATVMAVRMQLGNVRETRTLVLAAPPTRGQDRSHALSP
jgi:hypothetical protein